MRKPLICLASAMAALVFACQVSAAAWPPLDKGVHIIMPAPGGAGTGDALARLVAEQLSEKLEGRFVVANHGGANGNIAAGIVAQAPADGTRLLFSWAGTLAVSPSLYAELPFDPRESFDPIALIAEVPNILVVNNDLPVNNLAEFTAYVQKNPGVVNFGSTGNGSAMHLAGQLYMSETDTNMVHVPYRAPGQATTNLVSGEIQSMFQLIPGIASEVKSGQVKALGVMARERSPALPFVPTMAEQGRPELISSTWFALLAPKGTPVEVIAKANEALNASLQEPEVRDTLHAMGAAPMGGTPEDLSQLLESELQKWARVAESANLRVH